MAPINMKRYDTSTHEIPPTLYTQPSGRTLQQHTGSLPRRCPIALHLPVVSSDPQTFPILPEQLEKHLEQARQHIAYDIPAQAAPASGSAPSPDTDGILVLGSPGMMPTVYAFHASTLGMPSLAEYLRFLTRYLDDMTPNKRGKALIDSELLERIKLVLALQCNGFSGSGETSPGSESVPSAPYGTGGSWDTQAFRRWVRKTFVYRPATQAELERAIDFGLLSPPEISLSGPGVPGHAPSTSLNRHMNLVFHQDRPVALRSRIYKIILRAHWITNHAGRDRTWAMVREVCSYIPKCLVYDFVAACPICGVARSNQYHRGIRSGVGRDGSDAGSRLPPILPSLCYDALPEGWIPWTNPNDPLHPYPTPIPTHHINSYYETNAQMIPDITSDLPSGPIRLPPFPVALSLAVSNQTANRSQQRHLKNQDLQKTQQETLELERGRLSWMVMSSLIKSGSEEADGLDVLANSPALERKNGPWASDECIEPMVMNVGHEAMVSIPLGQGHPSDKDMNIEID